MTDQDKVHLSQQELAEIEGIEPVLSKLLAFLDRAKFVGGKFVEGRNKNTERCADDELPVYIEPLLRKLGSLSVTRAKVLFDNKFDLSSIFICVDRGDRCDSSDEAFITERFTQALTRLEPVLAGCVTASLQKLLVTILRVFLKPIQLLRFAASHFLYLGGHPLLLPFGNDNPRVDKVHGHHDVSHLNTVPQSQISLPHILKHPNLATKGCTKISISTSSSVTTRYCEHIRGPNVGRTMKDTAF